MTDQSKPVGTGRSYGCWALSAVVFLFLAINVYNAYPRGDSSGRPVLELLEASTAMADGYVSGTINNTTDKIVPYGVVDISLLDKDGATVGSTMANVVNLSPKQSWKFKAVVIDDRAVTFEITNIQWNPPVDP